MAGPKTNHWMRVDLAVKSLEDGSTTRTWTFTNKPYIGAYYDYHFPILTDVSELGVEMGLVFPEPSGGTFTVRDAPGSIGAFRKFSDVLQRWTAIEQEVTVYSFTTDIGDNDIDGGDWVQEWKGFVDSVQGNFDEFGPTLEFAIRPDVLQDKIVTRMVDSVQFPNAPQQSLGKHLPVVLTGASGNYADCAAVPTSAPNASSPQYAFATSYGSGYTPTAQQYYAQNSDGDWVQLSTASETIISDTNFTAAHSLNAGPRAWEVGSGLTTAHFCDSGSLRMAGNGTGGRVSTAKLKVDLWELDKNSLAFKKIVASALVDLSGYDASNNALANPITLNYSFDKCVLLDFAKFRYAVAFSVTGWQSGEMSMDYDGSGSSRMWLRVNDGSNSFAADWAYQSASNDPTIVLRGPAFNSSSYHASSNNDADGLGYAALVLSRSYSPGSGQTMPDISSLQFIVRANEANYYSFPNAIDRLGYQYSGGSHSSSGKWDTSTLSSAYSTLFASSGIRTRIAVGATEGRTSYLELIEELCRNLACRIGQTNDGKWFVWPWGYNATPAFAIPAEDITPITWRCEDRTSVVNRANLVYGKTLRSLGLERNAQEGQFSNYLSAIDWDKNINSLAALLATKSEALYGRRGLEDVLCDFIATSRAAETLVEAEMAQHAYPAQYVEFLVPYSAYRSVKLLDVVVIAHPAWPANSGAIAEDREPVYEDSGTPSNTGDANIKDGFYWVRAEPYRAIVEGRFRQGGLAEAPTLRLKCRLLTNFPMDPT